MSRKERFFYILLFISKTIIKTLKRYTREGQAANIPNFRVHLKRWVEEFCNMQLQPHEFRDTELRLELYEWLDTRIEARLQHEREKDPHEAMLPDYLALMHDNAINALMTPRRPMRYGEDIGGPQRRPYSPPARWQAPVEHFIGPLPYPGLPPIAMPSVPRPLTPAELAEVPFHQERISRMRPKKPLENYFQNLSTLSETSGDRMTSSEEHLVANRNTPTCSTFDGIFSIINSNFILVNNLALE